MRKRVAMTLDRVVGASSECNVAASGVDESRKKARASRRRKCARRGVVQGTLLRMCCCRIGVHTDLYVDVAMSCIWHY